LNIINNHLQGHANGPPSALREEPTILQFGSTATFSSGWTIRWRLFPSPARKGEAGPGRVSDDHMPPPIRQMDQGGNSEISSSAKSERNTNLGHKLNLPLCFVPW